MKWFIIGVNVLAAIAIVSLNAMAVAAHQTHAYSVYRELQERRVLVEHADYDVAARLRTIAAGGEYYSYLAHLGAFVCVINSIAVGFLCKRQPNKRDGANAQERVAHR